MIQSTVDDSKHGFSRPTCVHWPGFHGLWDCVTPGTIGDGLTSVVELSSVEGSDPEMALFLLSGLVSNARF